MFDFQQNLLETEGIGNLQVALGLIGPLDQPFQGVVDVFADLGPEERLARNALQRVSQKSRYYVLAAFLTGFS
jgi:hypothetical protein